MTANKRNIIQNSILSINDGILSALGIILGMSGVGITRPWLAVFVTGILAMGRSIYLSVRAIANNQNKYSAVKTMLCSSLAYAIGGIIPALPFLVITDNVLSFSVEISAMALFIIGYINHGKDTPLFSALIQSLSGIIVVLLTFIICIKLGG
ncbi:VIT1/CCC1 transporter family protein [Pectinatus frisingensis]|uniref:VIT1/CCC1 transporter family protein n=1 Tax=Pectinatus frisingensis TaxID=865 RepID=UPI001E4CCF82|nr:VIT1/CCC1 transporter family protein [Pectinatus frisingensis]